MRPESLDPFGSRARKMENYLLEEDDSREERTGYLYMELKRQESDTYITIGMGMRARKNKKLETWYFCITDGRRIGIDFWLYKDVQNKIAYSKTELRNRIGDGGRVMDSQNEYASCVNSLIFGFETIEEYKEMLDLLIQLRTPKLSKDFKPSVINDILSKSLQTLSEDDLRPMSEAIENMDTLKTNLDNISESIKAAKQIEKVYDQYNKAVLLNRAESYLKTVKEFNTQQKELEAIEEGITRNKEELEKNETQEQNTEMIPKQDYDELDDRYKRILAEFENFKKRSSKERDGLYNSILSDVVEVILPVVDNLENAAKAETADESYKQGVELVLKQFKDVLNAKGVEEIKAVGETFDPELHEAVSSIQDDSLGEKEIAQEYRKGYKIGSRVIRHSMVVVAN